MRNGHGAFTGLLAVMVLTSGAVRANAASPPETITLIAQNSDQRQTDQILKSKIEKRLRMDDRIDWELLQVVVDRSHATLYGEVRTPEEKGLAALIASTVPGVEGLNNSIIVEPAMSLDHKLAKAVWKTLKSVPILRENDTLKVNVRYAVAKLEGTVDQPIQKRAAEKAATAVPGVATVINLIEVNPKGAAEDITLIGRDKMLQEGVQLQP